MDIEKAKMMSSDITQENVKKIQALFPNAVTEVIGEDGKAKLAVDFDILKQELSDSLIDEKQERYQLTWPDKKQSILLSNKSILASLRPLPEKSVDFDNTKNIYIEGDNLDVLKLIRETYLGRIKMIYIDPPYNTGNDFIYNDDFTLSSQDYLNNSGQYDESGNRLFINNESNGRFHTDWLNMIYPRIRIAKDLLSEDGVIFISIDDHEYANLKSVCDSVFGEKNFIDSFIWNSTFRPTNVTKKTRGNAEYILCYSKSSEFKFIPIEEDSKGDFSLTKKKHTSQILNLPGNYVNALFPDGTYKKGDYGKGYVLLDDIYVKNGLISNSFSIRIEQSIWSDNYLQEEIAKGVYLVIKNPNTMVLSARKTYQKSSLNPTKIIDNQIVGDVLEANAELTNLFGQKELFDYPKPCSLLKYLISITAKKGDIIMDFFSGSATTAHAVLDKNLEGFDNHFILVQLPETFGNETETYKLGFKTLCDIGEERIRRASKKLKEKAGILAENLDFGFRVFKLDSSNVNEVYYNPKAMTQNLLEATVDNIKPDRTPLDLLFQVMLECGALLSSKIEEKTINGKKIFVVEDNYIAACFDDELDDKTIEEIAKLHPVYACFKGSSFNSDSANINAEQIFKTYSPNTEKVKVI